MHLPTIGSNSLIAFESSPNTFTNIKSLIAITNDANLLSLLHDSYDNALFKGDASPSVSINNIYLYLDFSSSTFSIYKFAPLVHLPSDTKKLRLNIEFNNVLLPELYTPNTDNTNTLSLPIYFFI